MVDAQQTATRLSATATEPVHLARATAYLLGGRVHTQADRAFAERLVARWPRWVTDLRASEAFLTTTVRTLRGRGFDQAIDLSAVLPTPEGPFAAFGDATGMRLVHVDTDPVTATRTAALLRGTLHRVVNGSPDDPEAVLAVIRRHRLLDLHRRVLLLAGLGTLESRPTTAALEHLLAAWGRELPAESLLVFTHDSDDARTAAEALAARRARALYASSGATFTSRAGAVVSVSLHRAGWLPVQPLSWATPGPVDVHAASNTQAPAPPDGRAASVLAGIAAYQPRLRTPIRHTPSRHQPSVPSPRLVVTHTEGQRR